MCATSDGRRWLNCQRTGPIFLGGQLGLGDHAGLRSLGQGHGGLKGQGMLSGSNFVLAYYDSAIPDDESAGVGVEILGLIGFAHEFLSPCKVYSRD